MKSVQSTRLFAATVIALLLSAAVSSAQSIDEITVFADLRERPAREVPASITVLDNEEIENLAVQHFEELINAIPNLNWSGDGHRARYFQIRGVGELEQYQGAPNPSVGFLIDNIDFSGIGTVATLFDMQQIEVLRGPQGIRYGANALAGLIYMRSAAPTTDFEGRVELTVGEDDTLAAGVAIGGSLTDDGRLLVRLSVHHHRSNGFRDNPYLGRDDSNGRNEMTVRGRLSWTAASAWQFDLAAVFADIDDGYDAFALDNSNTVLSDKPGRDAQRSAGVSLQAEYSGFPGATLTSISSVASSDIVFSYDADWGNDDSWTPVTYDYVSVNDRKRQTLSQEFRLVGDSWLLGLYAMNLDDEIVTLNQGDYYDPFYDWADSLDDLFGSDYEAMNIAVFGQYEHDVGETTRVTMGLRAERRTTDYSDSSGLSSGPSESMWGGELAVSHDHSEAVTSFVSVSKGYKAGGFNLGLAVPDEHREYVAEDLWNIEAGIKTSLLDNRLLINASVFANRRGDQQVRTSFQLEPGDPTSFGFVTVNVEQGKTTGVEADLRWMPIESLTLYANIGLLNAEFGDIKAPSLANLVNRAQAHAPDYSLSFGAAYDHPAGAFARIDVSSRDDFFFDVSHDQKSENFELVNLRVGYRADTWSVNVWARNLFDEDYAVRGFYFGNEPPDFPNTLYTRSGDPRQIGLSFARDF
jgi:outer membrane receptor protein involved in Fe transport